MGDLVKLRGDHTHPETLASGQTIAPGEPFERSWLGDGDERLLDEGLIIDAVITPVALGGEALKARADELQIKGRTKMSADELREAVALAESQQGESSAPVDDVQRIGS